MTREEKRYAVIFRSLLPVFSVLLRKYRFRTDRVPQMNEPFLMLANHATESDHFMAACAAQTPMTFVCGEHLLRGKHGKQLKNIPFRQKYGINIAKVIRGSRRILVPSPDEYIYPYDEVLAIGTQEEVKRFVEDMAAENLAANVSYETDDFVLDLFELQQGCYLDGKVLRDTNMRQKGCMVVGVERDGMSLMSPKPDFRFQAGDFVWLAGERVECEKMVLTNGNQEA